MKFHIAGDPGRLLTTTGEDGPIPDRTDEYNGMPGETEYYRDHVHVPEGYVAAVTGRHGDNIDLLGFIIELKAVSAYVDNVRYGVYGVRSMGVTLRECVSSTSSWACLKAAEIVKNT